MVSVIFIIASGLTGFFVGKGQHKTNFSFQNGNVNGRRIFFGQKSQSGFANGNSKLIILGSNTVMTKSGKGTKSDLMKGIQVTVLGSSNQDGSVTARSIQITE